MEDFDYELPKLSREQINQEVLEQLHQGGDFSSEGKAKALQQVLRLNAIKRVLDEGADMTQENINAVQRSIQRELDITIPIIPTQSSQPQNERIIEPTRSGGRDALIVAKPLPDEIQLSPSSRTVYGKAELDEMIAGAVRREVDAQKDPMRTSAPHGKSSMQFHRGPDGNISEVVITKFD